MKTGLTIDSSTNQSYKDMVKEYDEMRKVLHKHLDPLGVHSTSRFFDGAFSAMKEWNNTSKPSTSQPEGNTVNMK